MLPVILMLVVAPIGALDVLYFHIWKFRLYREPSARAETVTHLIRGFLFGAGAWLISSYRLDGAWFWAVAVVLLVDFVNEIADVALEGESRAPLGGLPTLESVIHIIGATFAARPPSPLPSPAGRERRWRRRSSPTTEHGPLRSFGAAGSSPWGASR